MRLTIGGLVRAPQDRKALPVLVLVDLAAGEPLGEQPLRRRRQFR